MFGTRQVIGSNIGMILLASEPGGCHYQDFPFSGTKGEKIFVHFQADGALNFFVMTEEEYQSWGKERTCNVNDALVSQYSVKQFNQMSEPFVVPTDGAYEFLFINTSTLPVTVYFDCECAKP
jgi:hypothetical protein